MAVTRVKQFTIDLGAVVTARLKSFTDTRKSIQARKETEFQRLVLEGMSYQAQLDYRKAQLEKEKNTTYPDEKFISDVKNSMSVLKQMVRYQKIRNGYNNSWSDYKAGKKSIESHILFLDDKLSTEIDPTLSDELLKQKRVAEQELFTVENNTLQHKIILAEKDHSSALIDKTIVEVEDKKSQAVLNQRTDEVTAYDVNLQALRSAKAGIDVEDSWNDLEFKFYQEGGGATDKLAMLDKTIGEADVDSPVVINGTTYNSAKDFWTTIKNDYIGGNGKGVFVDFVGDLKNEVDNSINKSASMSQWNYVPISKIDEVDNQYKDLSLRPDMIAIKDRLENDRLSAVAKITNYTTSAIKGEALYSLDLDKGMSSLTELQQKSGIDLTAQMADLRSSVVQSWATQPNKLSAAAEAMAAEKGISPQKAMNQLTPPLNVEPIPLPTPVKKTESATGRNNQITIPEGSTLSGLAQQHKTTVQELMSLNPQITDANKISAGAKLTLPNSKVTTPTPVPTPTTTPNTTPTTTPITTPEPQTTNPYIQLQGESITDYAKRIYEMNKAKQQTNNQ